MCQNGHILFFYAQSSDFSHAEAFLFPEVIVSWGFLNPRHQETLSFLHTIRRYVFRIKPDTDIVEDAMKNRHIRSGYTRQTVCRHPADRRQATTSPGKRYRVSAERV